MTKRLVYEGKGDLGIPARAWRDDEPAPDWINDLRALGCCAWAGRTGCNEVVTDSISIGESMLLFRTYRNAIWNGLVYAVFCAQHEINPIKDMPHALQRSQERERLAFLKMNR